MPTSDGQCDVAIIGAGIVGLAAALHLVRRLPGARLLVLDKENEPGAHQTGHNSGVIHSGLYYKPGSLKARLCVEGAAAMVRFCAEYGIPHEVCGKIVVATNAAEIPALNELLRRGHANGLSGLRELGPEQIREIEPHAAGVRAIHVPSTGITDYRRVALQYAELVRQAGGEILTGHGVERIVHGCQRGDARNGWRYNPRTICHQLRRSAQRPDRSHGRRAAWITHRSFSRRVLHGRAGKTGPGTGINLSRR